jgi:hypothetical protein
MLPSDSGASRCGHRSGAADTAPSGRRHSTYRSPSSVTLTGDSATSPASATTYHWVRNAGFAQNESVRSSIQASVPSRFEAIVHLPFS